MHIFKNHVYFKRAYAMIMKIPMFMHMITNENTHVYAHFQKSCVLQTSICNDNENTHVYAHDY